MTSDEGSRVRSAEEVAAARRLLLAESGRPELNRIARLAARLLGSGSAQVSLLTDVQTVAGGAGLPAEVLGSKTPLADSLCTVTATCGEPLVVSDARRDERVLDLPPVTSGTVGSYLGVPLSTDEGTTVGALCVFDRGPHDWSGADVALLEQLAASAAAELELAALTDEVEVSRVRWELAIEAAGIGSFDWDLSTGVLDGDERLQAMLGYPAGTFDRTIDAFLARVHPDDRLRVGEALEHAVHSGGGVGAEFRVLPPSGEVRQVQARGRTVADGAGRAVRVVGAVSDTTPERASEAAVVRVLEAMSAAFIALDHDWYVTYVNAEAEHLLAMSRTVLVGGNLWKLFPALRGSQFEPMYRAAMTGTPGIVTAYYPAPLDGWFEVRASPAPDGLSLYFLDVTERHVTAERLREANRRLAQVAEHERTIARALQDAMLTRLPEPDHMHLASRYLTATGTEQVGGDWYDAVVLPTGNTVLVIGDVAGHDIDAAAVMGQLRNLLRAFAWDHSDEPPSATVARLDRAIHDLRVDTLATLTVVRVEQSEQDRAAGLRTLRWANAGHPAPVLVHPDGTTLVLDSRPDLLLGADPDTPRHDHEHVVPPGATLLLYTDGLVETRTADLDVGHHRLLAAVRAHHRLPTEEFLDAVLADTVGPHPDDDVAVLAVRFDPEDQPRPTGS